MKLTPCTPVVFCREPTKSRDVLKNRSLRMRNFLPSLAFLTQPPPHLMSNMLLEKASSHPAAIMVRWLRHQGSPVER